MSEPGTPVIELVRVAKSFDHGVIRALDGVDLVVADGEFVALTGPSGCGKSTLLHLVAGLDKPTSGRINVHGQDLSSMDGDRYRRDAVGLVFQFHNLLPHLSALANVEVAMFSNGQTHRQQADKSRELLGAVGLAAKAEAKPPRLAGGERQRLAIARALANDPSILLADEPTGSLDSDSAQRILELFTVIRRARGVTVLMVTHDRQVASAAERIVSMRDGRIVAEGA